MAAPSGANPSPWLQFVPFVLVLAIFYFIILLPMKKKQQKVQEFLAGLKVNDRVITSGGIFGTVIGRKGEKDEIVVLKVGEDMKMEFTSQSIIQVIERGE